CAAAGHESTDCTAVEKCVNCDGKHTSFSRSCPKWKVEKEIVATKFKNNISFPEARRLVKAQSPPDGKSYASVVDKSHPVYQTTNCPHCNHLGTMSNPVPSTSKSPEPVTIASSSRTKNKNILPKPSSQTSAVSQDSSGFTIVNRKKKPKTSANSPSVNNNHIKANTATKFWTKSPRSSASEKAKNKILKNKTDKNKISNDKTAKSTSESSEGNSSDTDSDITVTSNPEASNTQKNRARSKSEFSPIHGGSSVESGLEPGTLRPQSRDLRSKSEKSQKPKQAKRGLSQKDLPAKLKKSAHHNSVALGLADKSIAHKDLPSIFGGVPQVPDLKLHPSDEDEDLQMNCDASETPPCVPTSNPPTLF
ncbi:hypothetical protein AVEN_37886-1, partial [Araneus ventricosus]